MEARVFSKEGYADILKHALAKGFNFIRFSNKDKSDVVANKKKTICFAANDVASVFKDLRRVFENKNFNVITYVDQLPTSNIIQQDKYDYWGNKFVPNFLLNNSLIFNHLTKRIIYKLRKIVRDHSINYQFEKISSEADIFVFLCNTFYEDCSDLEILKKAGKKIIFIFVGDDARWYYGMKQDFKMHGLEAYHYGTDYDYSVNGLDQRLVKIRNAEKFADYVFSKREQSQLQLRPFYHYPMIIHLDDYKFNPIQRKDKPIVVHAPSNPQIKGTKYVLQSFEKLKKEGLPFEYIIVENIPHDRAKEIYQNADIVVDQLYVPGAGKLASEAMAMGKVVLGRMAYETYYQGFPINECPIIDASPATIYNELKRIILDYDLRIKLSKKGRWYAENFLNISSFCDKLLMLLNNELIPCDYYPIFFKQYYIAESDEAKLLLNYWLKFVKQEDWYKSEIEDKPHSNNFEF